jgi:hypothetical protein
MAIIKKLISITYHYTDKEELEKEVEFQERLGQMKPIGCRDLIYEGTHWEITVDYQPMSCE